MPVGRQQAPTGVGIEQLELPWIEPQLELLALPGSALGAEAGDQLNALACALAQLRGARILGYLLELP
jgi:hypothetical protein